MSHKLQIRALLGLVVVITIVVGVLVWPVPKEAGAQVNYTVYAYWYDQGLQEEHPINDAELEFGLIIDDVYVAQGDFIFMGNGLYQYVANDPGTWRVKIIDDTYEGVSPWVGTLASPSAVVSHIDWQLVFPM